MGMGDIDLRHRIAKRAAQEIEDGMIVNLGIGIPTLAAEYIPAHYEVWLHAENGIMGAGASPARGKKIRICAMPGFSHYVNKRRIIYGQHNRFWHHSQRDAGYDHFRCT